LSSNSAKKLIWKCEHNVIAWRQQVGTANCKSPTGSSVNAQSEWSSYGRGGQATARRPV